MKIKKNIIPINDINQLDNHSFNLVVYMEGLFCDEYVINTDGMDYNFKKQLVDLLGQSYIQIYKLLRPRIMSEDEIKDIVDTLTSDVEFMLSLLDEYPELVIEIPIHYITITTYTLAKILRLEKYEIAANLDKFWLMWEDRIREKNWLIPI
jgi:hypothetical protein